MYIFGKAAIKNPARRRDFLQDDDLQQPGLMLPVIQQMLRAVCKRRVPECRIGGRVVFVIVPLMQRCMSSQWRNQRCVFACVGEQIAPLRQLHFIAQRKRGCHIRCGRMRIAATRMGMIQIEQRLHHGRCGGKRIAFRRHQRLRRGRFLQCRSRRLRLSMMLLIGSSIFCLRLCGIIRDSRIRIFILRLFFAGLRRLRLDTVKNFLWLQQRLPAHLGNGTRCIGCQRKIIFYEKLTLAAFQCHQQIIARLRQHIIVQPGIPQENDIPITKIGNNLVFHAFPVNMEDIIACASGHIIIARTGK